MQSPTLKNLSNTLETQVLNRRKIREHVLQALYAWKLGMDSPTDQYDSMLSEVQEQIRIAKKSSLAEDDIQFMQTLFFESIEHWDEHIPLVQDHLDNWDFERLAVVDKILIQMALTELLSCKEVPVRVTINECLELAKLYSTAKSAHFINGVVDKVQIKLSKEGKIVKTGRGNK